MDMSQKSQRLSREPKALTSQRWPSCGATPTSPSGQEVPGLRLPLPSQSTGFCSDSLPSQMDRLSADRPAPCPPPDAYPAVLIDGLQPPHRHVPDVASPEEDFAWKRDAREPGDSE